MIPRALAVLLLLLPALAWGQMSTTTRFLRNTVPPLTSAANTAQSKTITGTADTRVRLWSVTAICSAGSADLTITDAGVTVAALTGYIGTAWSGLVWATPYTATALGNTVVITVGACGGGNTSTLMVQADQSTP